MQRLKLLSKCLSVVLGLSVAGAHLAQAQTSIPNKIICEKCQFENPWQGKFCTNCGSSLKLAKEHTLKFLQSAASQPARDGQSGKVATGMQRSAREKQAKASRSALQTAAIIQESNNVKSAAGANTRTKAAVTGRTFIASPEKKQAPKQSRSAQAKERSLRFRKAFSKPVVIPSLFNVPTADVLGSLDIFFNGGGAFGIEKERHFLGQAGLGLGEIAQVEFSTQSVINSLQRGTTSVPTSSFKMRIVRERENWPALAMSLRGTTSWQHLFGEAPEISFETRLTKLYIVASKKIQKVRAHVGVGLTDVRVRNPEGWSFLKTGAAELQRNIWAPFGGISIRANPKAMVMMEIEGLPSYQFAPGGEYSDQDISNIWAGVIGIRFYFLNWLVADAGVRYRSDFDGIADAKIQANLSVLLPLSRMAKGE